MLLYYIWSGGNHLYGDYEEARMTNVQKDAPCLSHVTDCLLVNLLCRLIHPDIYQRASAAQLLAHPFFWTQQSKFDFMADVCKSFEDMCSETIFSIFTTLEAGREWMDLNDWVSSVGDAVYTGMRDVFGPYVPNVVGLLRFMYDVASDSDAKHLPEDVRQMLPEPAHFFLSRFSRVFLALYELVMVQEHYKKMPLIKNYLTPLHVAKRHL